jgi:hypothetical protein
MAAIARPGVCENRNRPMNKKLSAAAPLASYLRRLDSPLSAGPTPLCAHSPCAPHKPRTIPSRAKSEWPRNGIAGRALRGAMHQCPVATPAGAED